MKNHNIALENKCSTLEAKYAALEAKFRKEKSKSTPDMLEPPPTTPAKAVRSKGDACCTPAFGGQSPPSPFSPVMPAESESQMFRSPPSPFSPVMPAESESQMFR